MAKRLTEHQRLWAIEEARLKKIVKKLEKQGVYFNKSPIPEKKTRITRIALAKISSLTLSDIASKGYTFKDDIKVKYKPARKSPKRIPIYDIQEEKEKLRQSHLEAYQRYREKIEVRKKIKELTFKKETWTYEESKEYLKLREKERTLLSKKEQKKAEEFEEEIERIKQAEPQYDYDYTTDEDIPTKEEIPFPAKEQPITPNNEENIMYNEIDYTLQDIPIKDYVSHLISALGGAGFNSEVRKMLIDLLKTYDSNDSIVSELRDIQDEYRRVENDKSISIRERNDKLSELLHKYEEKLKQKTEYDELNARIVEVEGLELEIASELHESGQAEVVIGNANDLYKIITGNEMDFATRQEYEEAYYKDAGWSEGY